MNVHIQRPSKDLTPLNVLLSVFVTVLVVVFKRLVVPEMSDVTGGDVACGTTPVMSAVPTVGAETGTIAAVGVSNALETPDKLGIAAIPDTPEIADIVAPPAVIPLSPDKADTEAMDAQPTLPVAPAMFCN